MPIDEYRRYQIFNPLTNTPGEQVAEWKTDDYTEDPKIEWADLIPEGVSPAPKYSVVVIVRVKPIDE